MVIDTRCRCGWELPHSVMPMRNAEDAGSEDALVPGAVVTLLCPRCARGHLFVSPHEAARRPELLQKMKDQRKG